MSNCIELHNGTSTLKFHPEDISAQELLSESREHREHEDKIALYDRVQPCWNRQAPEPSLRCYIFHFFLNRDKVTIYRDRIEIHLGGHTWRDFRQTLWLIAQFLTRECHFVFKVSDEYDGHKAKFLMPVDMKPKQWPTDSRTGKEI